MNDDTRDRDYQDRIEDVRIAAFPVNPNEVVHLAQHQMGDHKNPFARMHPFTCVNRGDGNHRDIYGDLGALIPTVRGWICPFCDYTQNWAHEFMKLPR